MVGNRRVVRLADMRLHRRDWSNQELGQLLRLVAGFRSFGFSFETDRGVSDEGEPWFVFYDGGSCEVFAHFARISGRYVVCAPCIKGPLSGIELCELLERFVNECRCWQGTATCTHSAK